VCIPDCSAAGDRDCNVDEEITDAAAGVAEAAAEIVGVAVDTESVVDLIVADLLNINKR